MQVENIKFCGTNFLRLQAVSNKQIPHIRFCGTNFLRTDGKRNEVKHGIQFCGTNFLRMCAIVDRFSTNSNFYKEDKRFQKGQLSRGCQLCRMGLKIPVYVTMKCNLRCAFCPIDRELLNKDVSIVLGEEVSDPGNTVELCRDFSGVSLSGGEPLLRFDKVVHIIETLKEAYGSAFHIHLYTNGLLLTEAVLSKLEEIGLDEIRTSTFDRKILGMLARRCIDVTIETPVAKYRKLKIMKLLEYMDKIGLKRLILNEMEVTKANLDSFLKKGLTINTDKNVLEDSTPTAIAIIKWAIANNIKADIFHCSAENSLCGALQREKRLASQTNKFALLAV